MHDSTSATIAAAAGVAMLSGMFGAVGPAATATAMMAVIGLAFGEFAGLSLRWWQQSGWYLAGTLVMLVIAASPWVLRRDRPEWHAIAQVLDNSATLLDAIGSGAARSARTELASASATCRSEVFDHRLGMRPGARRERLLDAAAQAEQVAYLAADAYIRHRPASPSDAEALRHAARAARAGGLPGIRADLLAPLLCGDSCLRGPIGSPRRPGS